MAGLAGLAYLTENYTDDEEEDVKEDVEDSDRSFNDDKNSEPIPMDLDSENESSKKGDSYEEQEQVLKEEKNEAADLNDSSSGIKVTAWTEGVQLPPEPSGSCSPRLQETINNLMRRKQATNYDMNAAIQNRKAFRNPSIYEKLIDYWGIDEHGTNFPKELYDAHLFGKESHYEELAKAQKAEMDKREKAREKSGHRAAVDGGSGGAAAGQKTDDGGARRKSKWDQVSSATSGVPVRTHVIPAFGNLIKKA